MRILLILWQVLHRNLVILSSLTAFSSISLKIGGIGMRHYVVYFSFSLIRYAYWIFLFFFFLTVVFMAVMESLHLGSAFFLPFSDSVNPSHRWCCETQHPSWQSFELLGLEVRLQIIETLPFPDSVMRNEFKWYYCSLTVPVFPPSVGPWKSC